ncbi:hypothetical protein HHI36_018829 [Cryptolaemus montrouzieri]|uniref:G-protein coupled receptors family 2 profile 2 domain-containing protein n=1 Tax=Cryptolaemus montrouzieri TaxID=559131 RepID=A0ABD2P177_9CUCU
MNFHWVFTIFGILYSINDVDAASNSTKKRASEDYYQINYDYEVLNTNNSLDVQFSSDSLILPIPEDATKENSEESKDGSDIDPDLKDHDFIDNLMYIYYGSPTKNKNGHRLYASEIIIGGSVLSCIAQISTILLVLLKKDIHTKKDLREWFLNLITPFCIANLVLIFGIFKTKHCAECIIIAILLSYLHLITAVWIFLYCIHIYLVFCKNIRLRRACFYLCGYGIPLLYSVVAFLCGPHSYETRKFCFVSIKRGMIPNYMVPIFFLMIATAVYCIKGIRIFSMELDRLQSNSNMDVLTLYRNQMEIMMGKKCSTIEAVNLRASQSCMRRLCVLQTSYNTVWFFLVLALENIKDSSSMAVVYAFTTCCLNWYIFAELKVFFPTPNQPNLKEDSIDDSKSCNGVETSDTSLTSSECKQGSSDSVPLLIESTELKVLHHNSNISTIST